MCIKQRQKTVFQNTLPSTFNLDSGFLQIIY